MGQLRGYVARSAENADQDGVADQHRDSEGDAQHAVQPAPADGRNRFSRSDGASYRI